MKQIKNLFLVKIALILVILLLIIIIIRESRVLEFSLIIISLLTPLFFGFVLAWVIKPIMFYLNRYFNTILASTITYFLLFLLLALIAFLAAPVILKEARDLINYLTDLYKELDPNFLKNIDLNDLGEKSLVYMNNLLKNIRNIIMNIIYTIFISFFFLINHRKVSAFLAQRIPTDLIYKLSINMKTFVKGTLINTTILFCLCLIVFGMIKLPYFVLFAILISITNIIPYIGPYIGGIPAVLLAFGINTTMGVTVLISIVILQIIESALIHPLIMSRVLKINQILIMMSLIISSYFLGILGMFLSVPIICSLKTLYEYHKAHKIFKLPSLGKWFY